jgi:pyruvate carboxylase
VRLGENLTEIAISLVINESENKIVISSGAGYNTVTDLSDAELIATNNIVPIMVRAYVGTCGRRYRRIRGSGAKEEVSRRCAELRRPRLSCCL